MQHIGISVAVIVRNEAQQISDFLDSLAALSSEVIREILIVDNNSSDNTREVVSSWAGNHSLLQVKLLPLKSNNMAVARNLALRESTNEWLYFTDADCRLTLSGWQTAISFLNGITDEKIAAFGGGNITPSGPTFVSQGLQAMSRNWFGHMGSIQIGVPTEVKQASLLSTCNLFVKKSWALKITGCDLAFSSVGEDMSLCYELRKAGGALIAVPGMEVLHLQDRGLPHWCKKMFSYGKAQILTATKYPEHFSGVRGLQFLLMLLAMLAPLGSLQIFVGLIVFYLSLLVIGFLQAKVSIQSGLVGIFFILISQIFYGVGELVAAFSLIPKMLLSFPKKRPDLEKT
jgi:glycosyltransferase involved in cell wall biosynthesis